MVILTLAARKALNLYTIRFAFFAFPSAPASLPRLPATDAFSVLTRPAACSARSHASAASFVPSGAG